MGTDIHIAIEQQIAPHWWAPVLFVRPIRVNKTEHNTIGYARPAIADRNYDFFASLCGVRGDGPEAVGYPADINPATRHHLEYHGDHTPSWLPLAEFLKRFLVTRFVPNGEDRECKYPASEFLYLDRADEKPDEYRAIFNFDS